MCLIASTISHLCQHTHAHAHTHSHTHSYKSVCMYVYVCVFFQICCLLFLLFVWLLVRCMDVQCVRVLVCVCESLLLFECGGADFHSIVVIRRLEFNLNEMWQMGKKMYGICTRTRERSIEWMWWKSCPNRYIFFRCISFPLSCPLAHHSVLLFRFCMAVVVVVVLLLLFSVVVLSSLLSFFHRLFADIPRWSASLHTI